MVRLGCLLLDTGGVRAYASDEHAASDSASSGRCADRYSVTRSGHTGSISTADVHLSPDTFVVAGCAALHAHHSTAHAVAHYCHSDINQISDGFTIGYCTTDCQFTNQHPAYSTCACFAFRSADPGICSARLRDDRHADDLRLPAGA